MAIRGKQLPPLHPGQVLREEFMQPLDLTPYALAARLGVPRTRIERIAREEMGVTVDTALRLAAYFHTTAEFWMNLQSRFELETARRDREVIRALRRIKPAAWARR